MSTLLSQAAADPDWFVVSPDGSSATRILPGLRIGETELGVIALNDPMARNQLIRFDVSGADGCWLELMSSEHRMVTREGASIQRERVSAGLVVVLPNNRLVISPDLCVCKPNGQLVEVTAAPVREPPASIRTPKRRPRPASGRRLGWLILLAVALSAAAVLIRYPALQEAVGAQYVSIEDAIRTFIAENTTRLSLPAIPTPVSSPPPVLRSEVPSEIPPPPADLAEVPETSVQSPAAKIETVVAEAPDRRLAIARLLLNEGFIVSPPNHNAVAALGSLLADQPAHAEGLALLDECANRLIVQAISAKERGADFQARNTLEEVLSFSPENERARRLQRQWTLPTR